jgi:hypothetical protein
LLIRSSRRVVILLSFLTQYLCIVAPSLTSTLLGR